MTRYLKLLKRTFDISASVMLIYRANIVFFLIFETVFLAAQFLTVSVGYNLAGAEIAGWTKEQAFLLTAVNGLSHQVFICFFIGPIFNLGMQVWNGQFDYILLKPLHPLASMIFNGQFVISNLPNLCLNIGAVIYFLATGQGSVSVSTIPIFLVLILAGIGVRVSLALLCVAPAFYSERLADVEDSFWSIASLGRFPLNIYPRSLEIALTFVIPLGMMASVPSSAIFGKQALATSLGAFAAALAFISFSVWIFMLSLKRYQSVNSGM